MKLIRADKQMNDLHVEIKSRFTEFNRTSSPSKGRKYPEDLKELISRAAQAGSGNAVLGHLAGVTSNRISLWVSGCRPAAPRQLEVVNEESPYPLRSSAIIRLASGATIELTDAHSLTSDLLAVLCRGEVSRAASR